MNTDAIMAFIFTPWGMTACAILFILIFKVIYKLTSAIGFFRQLFMIAGIFTFCYFGFKNAHTSFTPFSEDWWKSAGFIWAGGTTFYMYLFADFAWEPHYYDEYTYSFVGHFLGAPEIQETKETLEEFHVFRWCLIAAFLALGTLCACLFLQDVLFHDKEGYWLVGVCGLLFLIIYIGRIVIKIVKAVRG